MIAVGRRLARARSCRVVPTGPVELVAMPVGLEVRSVWLEYLGGTCQLARRRNNCQWNISNRPTIMRMKRDDPAMYRLTTSIPYLLNRLGVRMGTLFSKHLERHGLTLGMYRAMACLVEAPGLRLGDLAQVLSTELSTMSRLISTMVSLRLVTRQRLPTNERTVSINLTPQGRKLALMLIDEAQHYENVAVSHFSTETVEQLKSLLMDMYEATDVLEKELTEPRKAVP